MTMTYFEIALVIGVVLAPFTAKWGGSEVKTKAVAIGASVGGALIWLVVEYAHGGNHIAILAHSLFWVYFGYVFIRRDRAQLNAVLVASTPIIYGAAALDATLTTSEIPVILWVLAIACIPTAIATWQYPRDMIDACKIEL